MAHANIITPAEYHAQQQRRRQGLKRNEFAGRNVGKPHGTFVTDEAEKGMCIILCWSCKHKFNAKRYQYYLTREFRIQGRCDACREYAREANLFIHESALGRKSNQCWSPK